MVLVDGHPGLYLAAGGRHLLTFEHDLDAKTRERILHRALAALPRIPRSGRRSLRVVEKVDGVPVSDSPLAAHLATHGFVRDYRGMTFAPEAARAGHG